MSGCCRTLTSVGSMWMDLQMFLILFGISLCSQRSKKCAIVSSWWHALQRPVLCTPISCRYLFNQHFPSRRRVIAVSFPLELAEYLIVLETVGCKDL